MVKLERSLDFIHRTLQTPVRRLGAQTTPYANDSMEEGRMDTFLILARRDLLLPV